jgi:arabinoxylan arabinofuranohydrolase
LSFGVDIVIQCSRGLDSGVLVTISQTRTTKDRLVEHSSFDLRFSLRAKRFLLALLSLTTTMVVPNTICFADNPFVQTIYTADPAPFVYNGLVYAFLDHDEDGTYGWFQMKDWRLFTTTDMVNWTDRGVTASLKTFSWGRVDAWAGQVAYRNGKFYYYVPIRIQGEPFGIGVGVADRPEGPYTDAIGKPLVTGGGYIDPSVFIDDDGQAYLYWGNPTLNMVKLNADMISYSGDIVKVPMNATTVNNMYLEGPWFYKRNGLYYLLYATQNNGTPGKEDIRYSTSPGPTGPWTYRGLIQPVQTGGKSWTNHSGIIDYKGKSYFFYHNGDLPGGSDFTRSSCVEEFKYNADGTIPTIPMTKEGPPPVENLNPFVQTEAETIAFSSGLKTEVCSEGGMNVTSINNGDYIKVKSVDFRTGAVSFSARVASATTGGSIEMHLDSLTGTLMGTCAIAGTGGAQTWATKTCDISVATGVHDLFFKFTGSGTGELFKFNWWRFTPKDPLPDAGASDASGDGMSGTAGSSGSGGATGSGGASGGSTAVGGSGGNTGGGGTGGSASGGATGERLTTTGGSKENGGAGGAGGSSSGGAVGSGGSSAASGGRTESAGGSTTGGSSGAGGSAVSASGGSRAGGGSGSDDARTNSGAGCSCQNAPGTGHSALSLLVLLAAALIRRHRPRARRRREQDVWPDLGCQ